jgi:hypothetical protein
MFVSPPQILLNVDRKGPLKNIALAASLSVLMLAGMAAQAQLDVAFGVNTVTSPSAVVSTSTGNVIQSLGRGAYLGFSGDYLFLLHHSFGVGGEIFWRAAQANYGGSQPYRPLFYDFDGVFAPRLTPHIAPELSAGIGAESVRFYTPFQTCSFVSCTNYVSVNHFMADFGGALRFYVRGGFFVRPEAKVYLVNNNQEFSSNHVTRYGVSIGYTFGSPLP